MSTDVKLRLALDGVNQAKSGLESIKGSVTSLGTAIAGAMSVREVLRMADAATTLKNQLTMATGSAQQSVAAYSALFDIAQRSRVSFTDLGATFAAISRNGAELGISQQRLLKVTESIGNAMTISGGSAAGMQAALVQLGQGIASGTLRGEELNSVMEQTPRLAKAIADGLGVSIGQLRQMGAEGKITAQALIEALEKSGPQLMKEVASASLTVGQAMTALGNSTIKFVGQADEASGASKLLAKELLAVSQQIDAIGNNPQALKAIALVAETAKLAWSDLKFTVVGVGTEIGGIAAQGAAILRGDFAGAVAIRQAMVEDGKAARTALDAYQKGVVSATAAAVAPSSPAVDAARAGGVAREKMLRDYAEQQDRLNTLLQASSGVSDAYIKRMKEIGELHASGVLTGQQYTDALDAAHKLLTKSTPAAKGLSDAQRQVNEGMGVYADLMLRADGFAVDYDEKVRKIAAAYTAGKLSLDDYSEAVRVLQSLQPGAIEAAKANTQAVDDLFEAQEKLRLKNEDQIKTAREMLEQIQFDTQLLGMNATQREQATLARELERQGIVKGTQAYEAYITQLQNATLQKSVAQANAETAKRAADDWKKASDQIEQALTDALMNGGKSGADYIEGLFRTMVLKPVVQAIVSPVAQSITGSLIGSSGALSGLSLLSGQFGTGAAVSIGNGLLGGFGSNMTNIVGQLEAGSFASALGMASPYIAGIGAALSIGDSLFGGGGGPKTEGTQAAWSNQLATDIESIVSKLGGTVDASISAFTSMDTAGDDLTDFAATLNINGRSVYDRYSLMGGRDAAKAGRSQADLDAAMASEASRMLLAAIQSSGLPDDVAKAFSSLDVATVTTDQLDAALKYADTLVAQKEAADTASAALAKLNQSWKDKLDLLTGATTERDIALRDAADETTRAIMRQVYAQEDLAAASQKAADMAATMSAALSQAASSAQAVADAEASIADIQLQAQIDAANATNAAADAMAGYAKTLRDYLAGEVQTPGANFASTLAKALAGNADAMQALPSVAKSAQDDALATSASSAEYALRKAQTLAGVSRALSVADAAAANRANVPVRASDLDTATKTLKDAIDALRLDLAGAIRTDLVNKIGAIDLNKNLSVDWTEFKTSFAGMASESTLRSIFSTLDADGDGQIDRLEAIKANTATLVQKWTSTTTVPGVGTVSTPMVTDTKTGTTTEDSSGVKTITGATQSTLDAIAAAAKASQNVVTATTAGSVTVVDKTTGGVLQASTPSADPYAAVVAANTASALAKADGSAESAVAAVISAQTKSITQSVAYLANNPDIMAVVAAGNTGGMSAVEYAAWHYSTYGAKEGRAFAKGGMFTNSVVSKPTLFNAALMGEAGPEAIMPLTRGPDGSLGVISVGSNKRLEALIEKLTAAVEALRADARAGLGANAANTAKTNKILDRVTGGADALQVVSV